MVHLYSLGVPTNFVVTPTGRFARTKFIRASQGLTAVRCSDEIRTHKGGGETPPPLGTAHRQRLTTNFVGSNVGQVVRPDFGRTPNEIRTQCHRIARVWVCHAVRHIDQQGFRRVAFCDPLV